LPLLVLFRWVFIYLLLWSHPSKGRVSLIGMVPGTSPISTACSSVAETVVPWVAIHVFHLSGQAVTYFPTGSGDTVLDYVEVYCYVVFAFLGTIVWSLLDWKRKEYVTLHAWFRIWIRFTLGMTLLAYGFDKVFPLQMQLRIPTLLERWGDFSPFSALWSFMAASQPYEIFSGSAEVLAGLLLLFRRTTLIGSMIASAVLVNVVALNYCYDVPVKLYSTNLALMAVFLMAPDLHRLAQLFLLNRPTLPADLARPFLPRRWMRICARFLWAYVVGTILYGQVHGNWSYYKRAYLNPGHPPINGLYEVERFARNGQETPPLLTDASRWHWLYGQSTNRIVLISMDDDQTYCGATYQAAKKTVTLSSGSDRWEFTYSWNDTNHLVLRGSMATNALDVRLRKVNRDEFMLLHRGFHWINQYPYSR
jgi:hypothetical protein